MSEAVFLGLLTAEKVITEEKTQRKTIVGTFTTLHSRSFPCRFPPWWVYASVTNVTGEHDFVINLVHDSSEHVVFSAGGKVNVRDPRAVIELGIPMPNVRFPQPGSYNLQLKLDGSTVGSRVLYLKETQGEDQPGQRPES